MIFQEKSNILKSQKCNIQPKKSTFVHFVRSFQNNLVIYLASFEKYYIHFVHVVRFVRSYSLCVIPPFQINYTSYWPLHFTAFASFGPMLVFAASTVVVICPLAHGPTGQASFAGLVPVAQATARCVATSCKL